MESATKKRRLSPTTFDDLPADVVLMVQDKCIDATSRLRLQSVIPERLRKRRHTDAMLSLVEYSHRHCKVVGSDVLLAFLHERTEASAREIMVSLPGFATFRKKKILMSDIKAEKLRDSAEYPSAEDMQDDFGIAWDTCNHLGGVSVQYFDLFTKSEVFARVRNRFFMGCECLYHSICAAKNAPLFNRFQELEKEDPWFERREKRPTLETRIFEMEMAGRKDSDVLDVFALAVSQTDVRAARDLFEGVARIRKAVC